MKKICFDLPGDSASPAGTRRGRAKALAEFIIRSLGERCPFKNPPALIKYWALGIAADGEVYMASQSTIGQHYWRTKGKGDPDIDVPVFEHFKFMETGGVRADEAKRMLTLPYKEVDGIKTNKFGAALFVWKKLDKIEDKPIISTIESIIKSI